MNEEAGRLQFEYTTMVDDDKDSDAQPAKPSPATGCQQHTQPAHSKASTSGLQPDDLTVTTIGTYTLYSDPSHGCAHSAASVRDGPLNRDSAEDVDGDVPATFREAIIQPTKILCGLCIFFPAYVSIAELVLTNQVGRFMVSISTVIGLACVSAGLALFTLGLHQGLMPLGNVIGEELKVRRQLAAPMGMILGLLLTFGEPAIDALLEVASLNPEGQAASLLRHKQMWTVGAIGIGVGCASALGMWRLAYHLSLRKILLVSMVASLFLTYYAPEDIRGLAWDSGAVTTGPVTVPVVLSLGSGVGRGSDAFGVVALASIFPVFGVILVYWFASSSGAAPTAGDSGIFEPLILSIRSFIPLLLGLFGSVTYLRSWWRIAASRRSIFIGLAKVFVGLVLFLFGLRIGLLPLGHEAGRRMANTFRMNHGLLGILLISGFGFFSVGVAQLVEPSLNVLGFKAEGITQGRIPKYTLIYRVAFGVAIGTVVGVLKTVYGFHLLFVLIPVYSVSMILNTVSDDDLLGIAWDAAGVTTGSITVPIILALGMGLAQAISEADGVPRSAFGILSCASVFPIPFVLSISVAPRRRTSNIQELQTV